MIAIVGGGLAGLAAAIELQEQNIPFKLFEAAPRFGGVLETITEGGYRLDYGFQILLAAYPSYKKLNKLGYLSGLARERLLPGMYVCSRKAKPILVADPLRRPDLLMSTLLNAPLSLRDRLKITNLRANLALRSFDSLLDSPIEGEMTLLNYLDQKGFSAEMIISFLRPFFGGVFASEALEVPASSFLFVIKAFFEGDAVFPAQGIGHFPRHLATKLPPESLFLNRPVSSITQGAGSVELSFPESPSENFEAVILATPIETSYNLLGGQGELEYGRQEYQTVYFQSTVSLYPEKAIFISSHPESYATYGAQVSNFSSSLAKDGHLISLTVLKQKYEGEALFDRVRVELEDHFPHCKGRLSPLKQFKHSKQKSSVLSQSPQAKSRLELAKSKLFGVCPERVFLAGEYLRGFSCQETALASGFEAAKGAIALSL